MVHSKLGQVNKHLGLNEKFSEVCDEVKYILIDLGLYDPVESTNLSVSAIIKIAGDIVFMKKGGIRMDIINNHCTCSERELSNKLDIIKPYTQIIF